MTSLVLGPRAVRLWVGLFVPGTLTGFWSVACPGVRPPGGLSDSDCAQELVVRCGRGAVSRCARPLSARRALTFELRFCGLAAPLLLRC